MVRSTDPAPPGDWFGQPRGLTVLFLTEMWEKFSFFGMRALQLYYMTKQLHFSPANASLVYGAYAAGVYLTPIVGGVVADRWLGRRRAVIAGGLLMALGHFMMASEALFFPAMAMIAIGNGLFLPSLPSQIALLYAAGDPRRVSAYNVYYVGVNLGALLAPLICGTLGEVYGWHYGFGADARRRHPHGGGLQRSAVHAQIGPPAVSGFRYDRLVGREHPARPALQMHADRDQRVGDDAVALLPHPGHRDRGAVNQLIPFVLAALPLPKLVEVHAMDDGFAHVANASTMLRAILLGRPRPLSRQQRIPWRPRRLHSGGVAVDADIGQQMLVQIRQGTTLQVCAIHGHDRTGHPAQRIHHAVRAPADRA